jgi:hypothetical protein
MVDRDGMPLVDSSLRMSDDLEGQRTRHEECSGRGPMRGRCLGVLLFLPLLGACGDASSGSGGGGSEPRVCVAHNAPEPASLSSPPSSFETDVAPVLAKSCAFSACHGSRGPANHGLFLGATNAENVQAVKTSLRNASRAAPSMPYVTPGDPDKSFLMHKLDGDQCIVEESCGGGDCGKSMPEGNDLLPETSRDAIRRWVAQGAN